MNPQAHPLGTQANVLLSSVFGPYAQDDAYGSRKINPMELYHNQVTRLQGGFSLRMFHRSFGLMLLQANIDAPTTLLDFPTLERFTEEISQNTYDVVGLSGIIPNLEKIKKMCELVRYYLPKATLIVGGHVTNIPGIENLIDADQIVRGEGVRWLRTFLGQDPEAPVRHPIVTSASGTRVMGINANATPSETAAILMPSVGCPMGCNFCSTSAMFGGKGQFINFYETGDALFSIMCQIEAKNQVSSFFVLDENFLLHRQRALRLLELMEEHQKSWSLYVFSSARTLQSYSMEQLVGLGISWVWIGLEGEASQYQKLRGVDTRTLVKSLQSHGIQVLGSTIIGLENHSPENIHDIIRYAISHATTFHQFMLYTPLPGTALYEQHQKEGSMLPENEYSHADSHGQHKFNFYHPAIPKGQETAFLHQGFQQDFDVNGPSIVRMIHVLLQGWQRHKNHPNSRIRQRFARSTNSLKTHYAGILWASGWWYRKKPHLAQQLKVLRHELYAEFGWKTRILAPLIGSVLLRALCQEEKRLATDWQYEPPTFCEKNRAAMALSDAPTTESQWVTSAPLCPNVYQEPLAIP